MSHVNKSPAVNGKVIGVGNVSTSTAKRIKLPEITETLPVKNSEPIRTMLDDCPIVDHDAFDFDDCNILEVIMFLQKLAKSPNASAINMAFTKHITNALMQVREEKLKHKASIPRKLEDGWEPIIKMKVNEFDCNTLCDLGANFSVIPKKLYDILDLPPLEPCSLDILCSIILCKNLWGELMMFISWLIITLSMLILWFWTLNAMHLVPLFWEDLFLECYH